MLRSVRKEGELRWYVKAMIKTMGYIHTRYQWLSEPTHTLYISEVTSSSALTFESQKYMLYTVLPWYMQKEQLKHMSEHSLVQAHICRILTMTHEVKTDCSH
jgi:hypothetical protein